MYKKGTDQVGQIIVSCERVPMESVRDYHNWKFILKAVNGGIQATNDYYMNKAPIEGYKPSIIVERDSSPKNSRLMKQKYYFTTVINDQLSYGNLMIDFEPHNPNRYRKEGKILYVPTCRIQMVARINLEGGRSLSIKPYQY